MTMTANGLAKLLEECGELSQIAAKKLAYFTTNEHPDNAGPLDLRMQDEIADVVAACLFVVGTFNLDLEAICARRDKKLALFNQWHSDPGNAATAFTTVADAVKVGSGDAGRCCCDQDLPFTKS